MNKCHRECKDNRRCIYAITVTSKDKTSKYEDPYYCGFEDKRLSNKLREFNRSCE